VWSVPEQSYLSIHPSSRVAMPAAPAGPGPQEQLGTILLDTWQAPDESAAQSPAVLQEALLQTRLLFHLKERLVAPDGNCLLHFVHGHCESLRSLWLKYGLGGFPRHIPTTVHGWRTALMQRVQDKKTQLLQMKHDVLESMLLRDGQKQTATEVQANDFVATFLRLNREDKQWDGGRA